MLEKINTSLKELGFKPNEIKVYIALTQLGESPASKVAKKVDLPRTTVISILEKLSNDNFLSTHKYKGTTFYWIESPKTLKQILENKIKIADDLDELLSDLYHTEADFPFAQIYDSKSSIKSFIEKTIAGLPKKSTIYTIDHPGEGNYKKIFSDDIGWTLVELKNKKQVSTNTLVPYDHLDKINPKKISSQNITVKELPPEINFEASMWLIKDTLVLFSGKYPFVVAIKHKIITQSMKTVYDFLWKVSK